MLFPLLSTSPHPLHIAHSDSSQLSGSSVTFREITGNCSISPKSDGLSCQLLNYNYICPFLSFLTHFLYKYSLWKKNLSRCSSDRACSWSLCFSVHTIALLFLLFAGKKKRTLSLLTCSCFSEESQWELVQRRFNRVGDSRGEEWCEEK